MTRANFSSQELKLLFSTAYESCAAGPRRRLRGHVRNCDSSPQRRFAAIVRFDTAAKRNMHRHYRAPGFLCGTPLALRRTSSKYLPRPWASAAVGMACASSPRHEAVDECAAAVPYGHQETPVPGRHPEAPGKAKLGDASATQAGLSTQQARAGRRLQLAQCASLIHERGRQTARHGLALLRGHHVPSLVLPAPQASGGIGARAASGFAPTLPGAVHQAASRLARFLNQDAQGLPLLG